jgi:hypothetical protein
MSRQTSITAMYAAERHRDLIARAEISRIARAARRRPSLWARLRRSYLASRPDLVPAPPHSDLAPAPPQPEFAPVRPQPDLAATRPLPDLASVPEPGPAATLPLPALSGAGADRAGHAG